jgi:hypothetical protein
MSALGLHRAADRRTMWSTTENFAGGSGRQGKSEAPTRGRTTAKCEPSLNTWFKPTWAISCGPESRHLAGAAMGHNRISEG